MPIAVVGHYVHRTLGSQVPCLLKDRSQFGEKWYVPTGLSFMVFRLGRIDPHPAALPVDPLPLEGQHFTRAPQTTEPRQRHDCPPIRVGARFQQLRRFLTTDELLPVGLGDRLAGHIGKRVDLNQLSFDRCPKELPCELQPLTSSLTAISRSSAKSLWSPMALSDNLQKPTTDGPTTTSETASGCNCSTRRSPIVAIPLPFPNAARSQRERPARERSNPKTTRNWIRFACSKNWIQKAQKKNAINYWCLMLYKYARRDSNPQPSVPKTDALSSCATGANPVLTG